MLGMAMLAVAFSGGGLSAPSNTSPEASDPRLSLGYSTLTTKVGDVVTLTAHLENATGAVTWSVDGPGALSATSGDEVAYRATAEGTAGVVASASGLTSAVRIKVLPVPGPPGGGSGSDGGSDSPRCASIEVNGLILNEQGDPIINQAVFALGHGETLTSTDGEGHFLIENVAPPYDLAMVEDQLNRVFVYKGLTRADPTLYVFTQGDQTVLTPRIATLNGNLTGGNSTLPPETALVGFGSMWPPSLECSE